MVATCVANRNDSGDSKWTGSVSWHALACVALAAFDPILMLFKAIRPRRVGMPP